jgi:hypothetical protein
MNNVQVSEKRYSPMHMEENHRNLSSKNIKRIEFNPNLNSALERRGMSAEKFSMLKPSE